MSSCLMRRWPPAVRVQGRNPDVVQRRMVWGETPSRRAASCTLRYIRKPYRRLDASVNHANFEALGGAKFPDVAPEGKVQQKRGISTDCDSARVEVLRPLGRLCA
jgi:hypothetical protein